MKRKLILYIAMSVDGYIAGEDDDLQFLSTVERPGEDYGHKDFVQTIDTVIWGRKTFDKVLSFGEGIPYKDKQVYVISKGRTGKQEHIEYKRDVVELVKELKQQEGQNIYCDGGAEIVTELLQSRLFNRIIISLIPYVLGKGVRLFKDGNPEFSMRLKQSITYPSGLVQLWYDVEE